MRTMTVYARKQVGAEFVAWLHHSFSNVRIAQVVVSEASDPSHDAAVDLGIPVLTWADRDRVSPTDHAVSILFPKRLSENLINRSRLGAINFHPAPLPEYRGVGGYNLAILEGLTRWAVTAHYMTPAIDAGPIIDVAWFDIDPDSATVSSLLRTSNRILASQAQRISRDALATDHWLPTTPNVGGRYVCREELEALKRIVPGDDIARKVRAFWYPPFRGAYLEVDDTAYTLVSDDLLRTNEE